jgi:outer membrane protein assembly factor BamB
MIGGLKLLTTRRCNPLHLLPMLLIAAALAACGGKGVSFSPRQPLHKPTLQEFISSRLDAARPLHAGGFSVYALDATLHEDAQALKYLSAAASGDNLTVTSPEGAFTSFSLYIRLPQGRAFCSININAPPNVLTLAIPGKLDGILPVGISALNGDSSASFTLTLTTSAGHTSALETCAFEGSKRIALSEKSASKPFEGVSNRVYDLEVAPNGTFADLSWTERNTGDYNNSGFVDVSDITPLAMNFNQPVDTPERELIDGNGDGIVKIDDLTQIAMNYGSSISGYEVVAVSVPSLAYTPTENELFAATPYPDPDDPSEPDPSVKRAKFYIGGQPPKVSIHYAFGHNMNSGIYAFAVRPYSFLGDDTAGALFSNTDSADFTTNGNNPPAWVGQPGMQAAAGGSQKVTLTFGDAVDPDGDAVHFIVYYEQNTTVYPPVAQSQRFDRSVLGSPPFSVEIGGLTNGLPYTFLVWAYDEHDLRENPPNQIALTAVPELYEPNTLPWPYLHKDEQRSGLLGAGLREPLVEQWRQSYKAAGTFNESSPVLDADNVYIGSCDGDVWAFKQSDGTLVYNKPADDGFLSSSTAALWGNFLVIGAPNKYSVLDISSGSPIGVFDLPSLNPVRSSPLILSGIAYCGSEDDLFYAFDVATRQKPPDWANPDFGSATSGSAASDGTYIYIASENGFVHKLDKETGGELATSPDLGSVTYGTPTFFPKDAPVVVIIGADTKLPQSKCYALAASDLHVVTEYDTEFGVQGAPVVVDDGTRNLVIVGEGEEVPSPAIGRGYISAFDLETGALVWRTANIGRIFASPVASADRIFAGSQNGNFYVLDFRGNIKQAIDLSYPIYASAALNGNRVFIASSEMKLYCFEAQPDTLAPEWQGPQGVRTVTTDNGKATVHWNYALDDFYSPVYYQLYWSDSLATLWDAPKVIDIDGGAAISHEYTVDGLTDGRRYYFGVRASDRPLWDMPNTDTNVAFIGATPPWNLKAQWNLGSDIPANSAEARITYLQTLASPTGDLLLAYATEGSSAGDNNIYLLDWDGVNPAVFDAPVLGSPPPATFLARSLEMTMKADGQPVLSFSTYFDAVSSYYEYAERSSTGDWTLTPIIDFSTPTQPAFSSFFGLTLRLQALFGVATPPPGETVSLEARISDLFPFEVPDADLSAGIHLATALVDYSDGNGEIPLIFYENADSTFFPTEGSLWLSRYDTVGDTWNSTELDAGDNAASNTGRNLRLLVDGTTVHLAYYDLNASDISPIAFLRHATYDGTTFTAENVSAVGVPDFSSPIGAQYYYHDPALGLINGEITLASYSRRIDPPDVTTPLNYCDVLYCSKDPSWSSEVVVERIPIFLHFRAPLGLQADPADPAVPWLIFPVDGDGNMNGANAIQIWQRAPL